MSSSCPGSLGRKRLEKIKRRRRKKTGEMYGKNNMYLCRHRAPAGWGERLERKKRLGKDVAGGILVECTGKKTGINTGGKLGRKRLEK